MTLFPKIVVLLHRVLGTRLFVAQFLRRTATSNEIFTSKTKYPLELRATAQTPP